MPQVKIDWETGPPLGWTKDVIHSRFNLVGGRTENFKTRLCFRIIREEPKLGICFQFISEAPSLELSWKPKIYERFLIRFFLSYTARLIRTVGRKRGAKG